jgi:hypothetical protein
VLPSVILGKHGRRRRKKKQKKNKNKAENMNWIQTGYKTSVKVRNRDCECIHIRGEQMETNILVCLLALSLSHTQFRRQMIRSAVQTFYTAHRSGEYILYFGRQRLWALRIELASCHHPGGKNFELDQRLKKIVHR